MADCEGENIVTMMDVLKEQQDFEDDANAVLGGSDEKECTYSQGYIKRQAIYSCMTCCPDAKDDPSKRAGFCLACSLNCHENHDLVELYTKRNFRCDCGNPKFKTPCQFTPDKTDLNDENVYNQNFIGLYCICNKPYGDQETSLDDEMIQCIICEDWWHSSHLDSVVPANDQYSEMVCKLCMAKNEFLHDYSNLAVNVENGDVDVVKVNGDSVVTDEKLTNDTVTDEKLLNGTAADEKLSNSLEEDLTSNVMETSATDAPNADTPIPNNDADSTEKESTEPKKLEIEPVENSENNVNNATDAPMETDDTDEAAEVLPEVSSEDKISEDSKSSIEKTEETSAVSEVITEETSAVSEVRTEESSTVSEEKSAVPDEKTEETRTVSEENTGRGEDSEVKLESEIVENATNNTDQTAANSSDIQISVSDTINKSSDQTNSETPIALNISTEGLPSETIDNSESKAAEEQDPKKEDAEEENDTSKENATTVSSITEHDLPSADNDPPNIDTNDKPIDINTDVTEAAKSSQDEEMTDVSKGNEEECNETEAKDDKVDETENCDSKSTNKETEENDKMLMPELATTDNKRKMSTEDKHDISTKKPKLDVSKCVRPKGVRKVHKGATFWLTTFRQKLCTCNDCISMYKDLSVLFLTDPEDTVFAYETLGKERTAGKPNQYEKGMEALCSLGRIQQIDALTEYNKMRDKLLSFLQSFKDKKEIVTESDIKNFFAGMKPEKRTDGVYFCG